MFIYSHLYICVVCIYVCMDFHICFINKLLFFVCSNAVLLFSVNFYQSYKIIMITFFLYSFYVFTHKYIIVFIILNVVTSIAFSIFVFVNKN